MKTRFGFPAINIGFNSWICRVEKKPSPIAYLRKNEPLNKQIWPNKVLWNNKNKPRYDADCLIKKELDKSNLNACKKVKFRQNTLGT